MDVRGAPREPSTSTECAGFVITPNCRRVKQETRYFNVPLRDVFRWTVEHLTRLGQDTSDRYTCGISLTIWSDNPSHEKEKSTRELTRAQSHDASASHVDALVAWMVESVDTFYTDHQIRSIARMDLDIISPACGDLPCQTSYKWTIWPCVSMTHTS